MALPAHAQSLLPANMTIEGRFFYNGSPINEAVDVEFSVYSSSNPSCVLYRETHLNQDVSAANAEDRGVFAIKLGSGGTLNYAPVGGLANVFVNGSPIAGESACMVTPGSAEHRVLITKVKKSSGGAYVQLDPTQITTAPTAMVAQTLQGKAPSDFLQPKASSDLNQGNLESIFATGNYNKLLDLINGSSGSYMDATPNAAVNFNSQRLTSIADPTAAQDAATKNYSDSYIGSKQIDLSTIGAGVGGGKVLTWDSAQNKWVAQSPSISGAAGGDLSGTYPNPSVANNAITSAKINDGAVGTADLADASVTPVKVVSGVSVVNRMFLTDGITGSTFVEKTCAQDQVLKYNTVGGWACESVGNLAPVTKVEGRTGNVDIDLSDLQSAGNAAARNVGTGIGDLVEVVSGGKLPALDGSHLTAVNAVKLQGRDVDGVTAPNPNDVLVWDGGTSKWKPAALPSSGEINSGVNVGAAGVGVYKTKNGVNLEFKSINAGSNKITVANDAANNEVDIDINEGNLSLNNMAGTLPLSKGGTNSNITAANGGVVYSTASGMAVSAVGSAGQMLISAGAAAPTWSNATYPNATTGNQLLYSSSNNNVTGLASANDAVLLTNASGVPAWTAKSGDNFQQYALLSGRAGGQTFNGGTAASENLTIQSTSNATKGDIYLNPSGGKVGIGTSAPAVPLDVNGTIRIRNGAGFADIGVPTGAGYTMTLPADGGTSGQILSTSGGANPTLSWINPSVGGEANTASNQGVGGVGLFLSKSALDLQFKNINVGSNKVIVTNDAANKEVDIDVDQTKIDHDQLLNYSANKHVDHSSVNIATAAGTSGLTGGGNLMATRNLAVDITGTSALGAAADPADEILIYDASAFALKKVTRTQLNLSESEVDAMVANNGYAADANVLKKDGSVALTADWDVGAKKLKNIAAPSVAGDAVNKGYADGNLGSRTLDLAGLTDGQVIKWDNTASKWVPFTIPVGGESNTASNVGSAGIGVYKQKTGVNLEFKKVNAASNKVVITDDVTNNKIDFDIDQTKIDHDQLLNYSANKHVDHSAVNIATAAGTSGLSGGGNLMATRNLAVDITGTSALGAPADPADEILIYDASAFALKKVTRTQLNLSESEVDAMVANNGYAADANVLKKDGSVALTADWDVGAKKLKNLAAPGLAGDAVNKGYADGKLGGSTLDLSGLTDGQVLKWNNTTSKWMPFTLPAGGTGDFRADGSVAMTGNLRLNGSYLSNDGDSEGVQVDNFGRVYIYAGNPELHIDGSSVGGGNDWILHGNSGGGNVAEAGMFRISNSYATKFAIDSTGKVLIGSYNDPTDLPQSQLDVKGGTAIGAYAGSHAGSAVAPANGLIVSGKVGIGTSSPSTALDVDGSARVAYSVANVASTGATIALGIFPSYNQTASSAANTDLLINRNQTAVGSGQQNLIDAQVNGTSKFRVDNTGKVFGDGSGLTNISGVISGLTAGKIAKAGSSNTLADSVMTESSGKIGIGQASPDSELDVAGSIQSTISTISAYAPSSSTSEFPVGANGLLLTNQNATDLNFFPIRFKVRNASIPQYAYMAAVSNSPGYSPNLVFGQQNTSSGYAERMRIDQNGNVGIGTTAPGRLLHVNGPIRVQPAALPGTPAAGDLAIDSGAANTLKYHNGSSWVPLAAGGATPAGSNWQIQYNNGGGFAANSNFVWDPTNLRLGVGTGSPGYLLDVQGVGGATAMASFKSTSGNAFITVDSPVANQSTISFKEAGSVQWQLGKKADNSFFIYDSTAAKDVLTASNGNVGIGITTPAQPLHVSGAMRLEPLGAAPSTPGKGDIYLDNTASMLRWYDGSAWKDATGVAKSGDSMTGALSITTNVGGTAPQLILKNQSNSGRPGMMIQDNAGSDMGGVFYGNPSFATTWQQNTMVVGTTASKTLAFMTAGGEKMRIDTAGNVGIGISGARPLHVNGAMRLQPMTLPTGGAGDIAYESSSNLLKYYNGTSWVSLTGGGAGDFMKDGSVAMTGNLNLGNNWISNDGSAKGISINNFGATAASSTLTSTASVIDYGFKITPTINQSGGTAGYVGLLVNVTETSLGGGSSKNLMDLQVGGSSKFRVNSIGGVTARNYSATDPSGFDVSASDGTIYSPSTAGSGAFPTGGVKLAQINNSATDGGYSIVRLSAANSSALPQSAYLAAVSNTGAGIYSPSIVIGQQTASSSYTERLRIDQNGKVGIGTSAPGRLLHVNGMMRLEPASASGGAAGDIVIDSGMSNSLRYHNGSSWVTLNGAGGTTPAGANGDIQFNNGSAFTASGNLNWDNSNNTLKVFGTSSPRAAFMTSGATGLTTVVSVENQTLPAAVDNGAQIGFSAMNSFPVPVSVATIGAKITDTTNGSHKGAIVFSTANGGTVGEKMRIDAAGKVGIGTTSPNVTAGMHINSSGSFATIKLTNSSTGSTVSDGLDIGMGSAGVSIWNNENSSIQLATNNTERLTIDGGGKVGIGTTIPNVPLEVKGAIVSGSNRISSYTGAALDLRLANTFVIESTSVTAIAFDTNTMTDGGSYTFIIEDGTASRTYTFPQCNSQYFRPANGPITTGTQTIYGMMIVKKSGNWVCYINWTSGYQ